MKGDNNKSTCLKYGGYEKGAGAFIKQFYINCKKEQLYFKISVKISQLLDDAPYGYIHKGIHTHIYIKSIMVMQIYTRAHTATCMQKTYIDAWQ